MQAFQSIRAFFKPCSQARYELQQDRDVLAFREKEVELEKQREERVKAIDRELEKKDLAVGDDRPLTEVIQIAISEVIVYSFNCCNFYILFSFFYNIVD